MVVVVVVVEVVQSVEGSFFEVGALAFWVG